MRIGKLPENAIKRSVWKPLGSKSGTRIGPDTAGGIRSQICPVTIPCRHQARTAVYGALNDLYAAGAEVSSLALEILLPPEAEEPDLRTMMSEAARTAEALGVAITGGHTEVTDVVRHAVVTASASGICRDTPVKPKPGWGLIVAGHIAMEGTLILAEEQEAELKEKLPQSILQAALAYEQQLSVREMADLARRVTAGNVRMTDLSRGGILASLWEFADACGLGCDTDLHAIPIRQETIEITEVYGLNPYQMMSGGALLMAAENSEAVVNILRELGFEAAVIGTLTSGRDRVIRNREEKRFLDLPQTDELIRFYGER